MQRFVPQDGASGLAPHPHRVELTCEPGALAFPPLCPNCGAAATDAIVVRKVFRRTHSDAPSSYVVSAVRVPFCGPCVATHERERERVSLLRRVVNRLASEHVIAPIVIGTTGLFFGKEAVRRATDDRPGGDLVLVVLSLALFAFAGVMLLVAWGRNEHADVPPQTRVTRAFDFGDEDAHLFESPRRVYAMRDPDFAEAFLAANGHRVYDPASPEAQQARSYRTAALLVGVVVLVASLLWGWLAPG